MTVYRRVEKAARGWYIFAIESPGGAPVYSETRGPFKTEDEATQALYGFTAAHDTKIESLNQPLEGDE